MTTGKTIALTIQTFVGKVISLLFNTPCRLVIAFVARSKHLLISWLPGGSVVKNPPAVVGNVGLIPGSGGSPREGNGNPFQYSCLGNPMNRGAWCATACGVEKESDTT